MKKNNWYTTSLNIATSAFIGVAIGCWASSVCRPKVLAPAESIPKLKYEQVVSYEAEPFYSDVCHYNGVIKEAGPCPILIVGSNLCYRIRSSYLDKRCPDDLWVPEAQVYQISDWTIESLCRRDSVEFERCKQYYEKD